jgi:hypothetical protein
MAFEEWIIRASEIAEITDPIDLRRLLRRGDERRCQEKAEHEDDLGSASEDSVPSGLLGEKRVHLTLSG